MWVPRVCGKAPLIRGLGNEYMNEMGFLFLNISFVAANSKSILGTFGYLASQEALRALTFYEKVFKKNIFSCIILL